ncbi:cupin domain-containing protein [Conexibacter woesei]|uniref:cupin domain-containing protein n=1 Tax=Conexibacter woesei TaxID=191495 RepID=UPI00040F7A59|nr:cupin domain-containing protein [Conexibacter woesei]
MPEAKLDDGVPQTAGWFVVNARDAPWIANTMRTVCRFGGEGDAHFDDMGIALFWLQPGQPMALYHHEAGQEDFLVLQGTALLIAEDAERPLGPWDLVHCPPRTGHTIVATGEQPALILAAGARKERGSAQYPYNSLADRHGAAVHDGDTADVTYARSGALTPCPAPPLP